MFPSPNMKKEEQKEEKKKKKKKTVPCESGLGLNQEWILKNISVFKGRLPAFCPFWNSIFPIHPHTPLPILIFESFLSLLWTSSVSSSQLSGVFIFKPHCCYCHCCPSTPTSQSPPGLLQTQTGLCRLFNLNATNHNRVRFKKARPSSTYPRFLFGVLDSHTSLTAREGFPPLLYIPIK